MNDPMEKWQITNPDGSVNTFLLDSRAEKIKLENIEKWLNNFYETAN